MAGLVFGLSLACLWLVFGLSLACLWLVFGLSLACLWLVFGLSLACLWLVFGLSLACLWLVLACPGHPRPSMPRGSDRGCPPGTRACPGLDPGPRMTNFGPKRAQNCTLFMKTIEGNQSLKPRSIRQIASLDLHDS